MERPTPTYTHVALRGGVWTATDEYVGRRKADRAPGWAVGTGAAHSYDPNANGCIASLTPSCQTCPPSAEPLRENSS